MTPGFTILETNVSAPVINIPVVACAMMKDEEDVAYEVVRHLAGEGVQHIVVADNMSSDNTRSELERVKTDLAASSLEEEARCAVTIVDDLEPGYYQSNKMTELARAAVAPFNGDAWVLPFDADEIWYGSDRLSYMVNIKPYCDKRVIEVPMWNHYGTGIDENTGRPFADMVWKMPTLGALPKVLYRWHPDSWVNQGNHSVTFPAGINKGDVVKMLADPGPQPSFGIRHFPYRSWEHFKRKAINGAAAYAATDLPYDQGAHWRQYGQLLERFGEDSLRVDVYEKYFYFMAPVNAGLLYDPAPLMRWRVDP